MMDESGLRDTILQFLRTGDHPMAGTLLSRVLWRLAPWTDSDGRLTSLWLAGTLERGFAEGDDPRPSLLSAFDLVEGALRMSAESAPSEGLTACTRLLLRQSFPMILGLADAGLMDRWLALQPQPSTEQLEQAITQVYLKRHQWPRIAQLLHRLPSSPSAGLYHELFSTCIQASLQQSMRRTSANVDPTAVAFDALRGRIGMLRAAGVRMDGNMAAALEALLLEHMAPPSFIEYLERVTTS